MLVLETSHYKQRVDFTEKPKDTALSLKASYTEDALSSLMTLKGPWITKWTPLHIKQHCKLEILKVNSSRKCLLSSYDKENEGFFP